MPRNLLSFPNGIDDQYLEPTWQSCANLLGQICKSKAYSICEAEFAENLSASDIESLYEATRDVLTHHMRLAPRDMGLFLKRPKTEPFFTSLALKGDLSVATVELIAGHCVGKKSQSIRLGRQFTAPDYLGRNMEFISADEVPAALELVCRVWNEPATGAKAVARAIWIFVAILNAHAFDDGNGRLARFLLNAYLIKCGVLEGLPIPFGPLIYAAGGNVELAIRRALALGEFSDIADVFQQLLHFYCQRINGEVPTPYPKVTADDRSKGWQGARSNVAQAVAAHFPVYLRNVGQRYPENSSPYVLKLDELTDAFKFDEARTRYITNLIGIIQEAEKDVLEIPTIMIGGEFINKLGREVSPDYIDVLIFYKPIGDIQLALSRLSSAITSGFLLDIRIKVCPLDADPLILIKSVSFFSVTYGKEEESMLMTNGLIILDRTNEI